LATSKPVKPHTPHPTCPPDVGGVGGGHTLPPPKNFFSRPYLFPQFFEDKATEHLLGEGIEPKLLNDDKIGRVMDKLYQLDVSGIFLLISLAAVKKFGVYFARLQLAFFTQGQ
jgi:hypothetical protein